MVKRILRYSGSFGAEKYDELKRFHLTTPRRSPYVLAMLTPARILRAHADSMPGNRPKPSPKERDREDRILHTAEVLMARFGRSKITMTNFALALRMSRSTIRWHFVDLDCVLAEILQRHLRAISKAIGGVPPDAPDLLAARRAAYLAATRQFGALTQAHRLLTRDRHMLPRDLLEPVEQMRDMIGESVGGANGAVVLSLLDGEVFQARQIEAMIAVLDEPSQERPVPDFRKPDAEPPKLPSPPIRFQRVDQRPATADQPTRLSLQPRRSPPRAGPH
jgi:AcrR family transcriptional regulator